MKIIGLTEAKDKLSSVIEQAKNNPTIITKNGKTAAILIVPEDDFDLERLLLSRSQMLQDVLRERHEENPHRKEMERWKNRRYNQ